MSSTTNASAAMMSQDHQCRAVHLAQGAVRARGGCMGSRLCMSDPLGWRLPGVAGARTVRGTFTQRAGPAQIPDRGAFPRRLGPRRSRTAEHHGLDVGGAARKRGPGRLEHVVPGQVDGAGLVEGQRDGGLLGQDERVDHAQHVAARHAVGAEHGRGQVDARLLGGHARGDDHHRVHLAEAHQEDGEDAHRGADQPIGGRA